jgi:hypothetical protein
MPAEIAAVLWDTTVHYVSPATFIVSANLANLTLSFYLEGILLGHK